KSSSIFALTTSNNYDNPPNDDDVSTTLLLLLSAPVSLLCDDVDNYYEYCHAINELVEDSLDCDPYG
ncbi:hypothetical protein QOT17_009057, partial [Balamuthia mandrillaris]